MSFPQTPADPHLIHPACRFYPPPTRAAGVPCTIEIFDATQNPERLHNRKDARLGLKHFDGDLPYANVTAFGKPAFPHGPRWRFCVVQAMPTGAILWTADHLAELQHVDIVDLMVTLPVIGSFDVTCKVNLVENAIPSSGCRVHVSWREATRNFLNCLAEFMLLADPSLTPAGLRQAGFNVGDITHAITYEAASVDRDIQEIWKLRLCALQSKGHCLNLTAHDLSSPIDEFAAHLVCRFHNRIVSYVRLIDVGHCLDRSQYICWGKHEPPPWLLQSGFSEAGAGATDPQFQRVGLFTPLMQFVIAKSVSLGHRFVLGACEDGLLEMYREMGFALIESREVSPRKGWTFNSHLIYLDVRRLVDAPPAGKLVAAMAAAARSAFTRPSESSPAP